MRSPTLAARMAPSSTAGEYPGPRSLSRTSSGSAAPRSAVQDLVVKVRGGKVLLDHVSFPVPESCLLCIIGPSGAGKSTLLGALTGLRPPDTGIVLYDDRD